MIKKLIRRWRLILWVFTVLLSLGLCGVLLRSGARDIAELTPQTAAERWETEEKPYAMASVFLPEAQAVPADYIGQFRLSMENVLLAAGVGSETHPWYYAFSRTESATLSTDTASTEVDLCVVSGEYFRIHPMELRSGWYPSEDHVMLDRIVLDRQTAWDLFYSDNVVGMYLQLKGHYYEVAAVVDIEEGKYNEMAAGGRYAWVLQGAPGVDTEKGFTCVEAVLPQPVKNYAVTALRSALGSYVTEQTAITDNSGRFSLENRIGVLRSLSTRGIVSEAVAYPYWENAARLTENHLALMLIPELLLVLYPLVSVLIWLVLLNRKRTWGLHSIRDGVEYLIDRRNRRNYEKKYGPVEPEEELLYEDQDYDEYDEYYEESEYDEEEYYEEEYYDEPYEEYEEDTEEWE